MWEEKAAFIEWCHWEETSQGDTTVPQNQTLQSSAYSKYMIFFFTQNSVSLPLFDHNYGNSISQSLFTLKEKSRTI